MDVEPINLPQLSSHPSCTLCDLHQEAKNPGIATIHYDRSLSPSEDTTPLIVVGLNPGYEEDQTNTPFKGESSRMLKNVYLNHDDILKNSTVYLTNAARCPTVGEQNVPRRSDFKACWIHLQEDIANITAFHKENAIILCLGSKSYESVSRNLLGKSRTLRHAFNNQGEPATHLFTNEVNIYATFHPAAVLRKRNYIYPVSDHINLLGNALIGNAPQVSLPIIVSPRSPHAI